MDQLYIHIYPLCLKILFPFIPDGSDSKEAACSAGDPGLVLVSKRCPGEGMATHSSFLAWKIPWREESGRLQSMGLQRVRHNSGTNPFQFQHFPT